MVKIIHVGTEVQDCTQHTYAAQQECHAFRKNGKLSRLKWTKNIKTEYLFVMYRVAQGDLVIENFPAERI